MNKKITVGVIIISSLLLSDCGLLSSSPNDLEEN